MFENPIRIGIIVFFQENGFKVNFIEIRAGRSTEDLKQE
jgi:hypothetical protein